MSCIGCTDEVGGGFGDSWFLIQSFRGSLGALSVELHLFSSALGVWVLKCGSRGGVPPRAPPELGWGTRIVVVGLEDFGLCDRSPGYRAVDGCAGAMQCPASGRCAPCGGALQVKGKCYPCPRTPVTLDSGPNPPEYRRRGKLRSTKIFVDSTKAFVYLPARCPPSPPMPS